MWKKLCARDDAASLTQQRHFLVVGECAQRLEGVVELLSGETFEASFGVGAPLAYADNVLSGEEHGAGAFICSAPLVDQDGASALLASVPTKPLLVVIAVDVGDDAKIRRVADNVKTWSNLVASRFGEVEHRCIVAVDADSLDAGAWHRALRALRQAALDVGATLVSATEDEKTRAATRRYALSCVYGGAQEGEAVFGFIDRSVLILTRGEDSQELIDQIEVEPATLSSVPKTTVPATTATAITAAAKKLSSEEEWLEELVTLSGTAPLDARSSGAEAAQTPTVKAPAQSADSGQVRSFFEGLLAGDSPLTPLSS